jgi:hypothetical protein
MSGDTEKLAALLEEMGNIQAQEDGAPETLNLLTAEGHAKWLSARGVCVAGQPGGVGGHLSDG